MNKKLKVLMDDFGIDDKFLEDMINNAIICGKSIVELYDYNEKGTGTLGKARITNLFTGCNCDKND